MANSIQVNKALMVVLLIVVQNRGIIFNGVSPRVIYAIHWVCLHVTGATRFCIGHYMIRDDLISMLYNQPELPFLGMYPVSQVNMNTFFF